MSVRQQIAARLAYLQAELNALAALIELHVSEGEPAPVAKAAPKAPAVPAVAAPASAAAPKAPPEPRPAAKAAPVAKSAPKAAPKAPAAEKAPRKRGPQQWSYAQTAKYRLSGPNPFRNGNNRALYDHLQATYGTSVFTRSQLGDMIARLRADQVMDTVQEEQPIVIEFVRFAGKKGRLAMA